MLLGLMTFSEVLVFVLFELGMVVLTGASLLLVLVVGGAYRFATVFYLSVRWCITLVSGQCLEAENCSPCTVDCPARAHSPARASQRVSRVR